MLNNLYPLKGSKDKFFKLFSQGTLYTGE